MTIFVTHTVNGVTTAIKKFNTYDLFWKWMQEYESEVNETPTDLCVFHAECIFDGS